MKTAGHSLLTRVALVAGTALVLGFLAATARASMRSATLEAIHCVENPHDSLRPGRRGELGAYQFRSSTWRMHTDVPFERALTREESEKVAIQHYDWLKRGLERNGVEPTPYNIALAWNAGLAAAVRGRAPTAARDYAERVNNLAQEFQATRLATAQ